MSVRNGVWTPWADVLCVQCHTATVSPVADASGADDAPGGACDQCGVEILLPPHVAPLAWLRRQLPGGDMVQTGGMCAALVFRRGEVDRVVVAADVEAGEPVFYAGVYDDGEHAFPSEAAIDTGARGLVEGLALVRRLVAEYVER